jgi:hypothetical protein
MNLHQEANHSLMEHFFKDKHVQAPRMARQGDIIDKCICKEKESSIASYYLNRNRKEKLVAYVRASQEEDLANRLESVEKYCLDNGYQIVEVFTDISDHPSYGFKAAFEAMKHADGLISFDLDQFVGLHADRIRELRPFMHHFFCLGGKHLITVSDGIDTGTMEGQENAIALITETHEGFNT